MRVLHLPSNAASQISIMVRAQRSIGLDARGLVIDPHIMQTSEGIRFIAPIAPHVGWVRRRWQAARRLAVIASAVQWADIVHWHSNTRLAFRDADLKMVAALDKARIVEFWGSDIRIPEIATRDNPYLAKLLADSDSDADGRAPTYPISQQRSRCSQERFARHGFECLVPGPELPDYIQQDLFPSPYRAEAVLNLEEFVPSYPDPDRSRPVVVHTPSRLAIKGTAAVLAAVEQLKARYDFEFRLVHNVPRAEALEIVCDCDILLDQFVIGSFGTAALEAMAFGKPAVCYLKPSVVANLPADAPYVNANPDNLAEVVTSLLADGSRRQEIGRNSRAYVEKHHDARTVARQLAGIYAELLSSRHEQPRGNRGKRERRETS
jgi:glycosyltransferase involved in cell wall biosynthesis